MCSRKGVAYFTSQKIQKLSLGCTTRSLLPSHCIMLMLPPPPLMPLYRDDVAPLPLFAEPALRVDEEALLGDPTCEEGAWDEESPPQPAARPSTRAPGRPAAERRNPAACESPELHPPDGGRSCRRLMSEMPALAASCVPRSVSSGRSADEDDSKRFPVVRRGVPETAATNSRRMASAGEGWLPGRPPEVLPAGGA